MPRTFAVVNAFLFAIDYLTPFALGGLLALLGALLVYTQVEDTVRGDVEGVPDPSAAGIPPSSGRVV